ncbi:2-dehydro-3-deoxygluconokinase [Paenibacillus shirakamiensis]|uniref:2-dehydro-3-deoxygluconokinase n=1 Tax=Paenibacillus shirakamiensis TaxID=1265935 RepID=A0ABS4JF26_9BACL|nr:sugar kinase [Paenibacillus shirakamiensis]MBP2000322.1 2-dehydro-3-deoxygluconokinase [Paenibacillus shirakamiensis]
MPKRISAFGEVMMRLQVPGYDTLAQGHTLQYTFSGTGVNIASALSRLGHIGALVTTVPANPLGESSMAYLRKLAIDTSFVRRAGQYMGMYFLENGFGARPSRVTYTDRWGSSFNTALPDAYAFDEIAKQVDIAHFCGITLAMNETVRHQMKSFAAAVQKQGGTVIFDCNYRPSLWGEKGYELAKAHYEDMLELADVVLMNERDAIHILGMRSTYEDRVDQLKELVPLVAEQYNIQAIAGTHRGIEQDGRHSLQGYLYKEGAMHVADPLTFAVYDRIGAGDAFASGIVHGEASGWEAERTLLFAVKAAVHAHTIAGDTPNATEIEILELVTETLRDVER